MTAFEFRNLNVILARDSRSVGLQADTVDSIKAHLKVGATETTALHGPSRPFTVLHSCYFFLGSNIRILFLAIRAREA